MKTNRLNLIGLALGSVVTALLAHAVVAAAAVVAPVSGAARLSASAAGGSFAPVMSADGRFVAFVSGANNLATNDDRTPYLDVFVRDRAAGTTLLVSVSTNGTGGGNADASFPMISAGGRFVAFASAASNLVPGDTNNASDVFVRDLVAGTTTLASVDLTGRSPPSPNPTQSSPLSAHPLLSADGRRVFFESLATNLVAQADTNRQTDVFARDLLAGTTVLVSVATEGTRAANGKSELAAITPDGRYAAFTSTATDLAPHLANAAAEVYVRDLQSGTTICANTNTTHGFPFVVTGASFFNPALSDDGRFITFAGRDGSNSVVWTLCHDLTTGITTPLASNSPAAASPALSADGRFVAFEDFTNVYVWDRLAGSNALVSLDLAGTGPANGSSRAPVISTDGSLVAFVSSATNLTTNAMSGATQIFLRNLTAGITRLVTVNLSGRGTAEDHGAAGPALSADGRALAFESASQDLATDDLNAATDVFVRDLAAATTELVSARHAALPAFSSYARSGTTKRGVSGDGRSAGFLTTDRVLLTNDPNSGVTKLQGAFARDRATRLIAPLDVDSYKLYLLSPRAVMAELALSRQSRHAVFTARSPLGISQSYYSLVCWVELPAGTNFVLNTNSGGGYVRAPATSADGRAVVFNVYSSFLPQVILHDVPAQTNQVVSARYLDSVTGNGPSTNAAFTPDDRWVIFTSWATDLLPIALVGNLPRLYARDLWSNVTSLVSIGTDGNRNWAALPDPALAEDSLHVAFVVTNVAPAPVIAVHHLGSRTTAVVCTNCASPSVSGNGRLVAFETPADAGTTNIVALDRQTGATNLISVNQTGSGGGNGSSTSPLLSSDGRFVVFVSKASDLVANDTNNASDIFVRDRLAGATLLASMNRHGTGPGNGPSTRPVLAADGRTVVFHSFASDLIAGDYNDTRDVFVLQLGGGDADGDGLDDDWELAYFNSLGRDGSADFDQDGATDRQEFFAGTDPTNDGSFLRVLTVSAPGGGSVTILWAAVPGRTYRVQFRDDVATGAWADLPGTVTATGTMGAKTDSTAPPAARRFYRVALAE
jgi:Tol biopolymer transport system component